MALKYIDSMGDHYTAAQINTKWSQTFAPIRDTGLHGYGMRGNLMKGMLFGSTTIIMEAYIRRIGPAEQIFEIGDTNPATYPQINVGYSQNGAISVSLFGPAPPLVFQSAPDLIRQGIWYHFAWRVLLHPSAGTLEIRVNGGEICHLTGIKTTSTIAWTGAVGWFRLGSNANTTIFDDLVVMDDVDDGINDPRLPGGGGFDKFLGPVEITVKRPNGAGLSAEWVPAGAAANWSNVDDPESDDDATYNGAAAAAVGTSDLFTMEDLLPTEDVVACQSLVLARKTEEGIAAAAVLVRDGATTTVGATVHQPSSYAYMHRPEPTLPDGSLWTKARWDAIQYGYRRIE